MKLWIGQLNDVYSEKEWKRLHPNFLKIRDAISKITKGTFETENQKINVLDSAVFDAIAEIRPKSDRKVSKLARAKDAYMEKHKSESYNMPVNQASSGKGLNPEEIEKHQIVKMADVKKCRTCGKAFDESAQSNKVYCDSTCRKEYNKLMAKEIADKVRSEGLILDTEVVVIEEQDNIEKGATGRLYDFKYDDGVAKGRVHFGKGPNKKDIRELVPVYALAPREEFTEAQKEAAEHPETFEKIQKGEIKTAEDLGKSIAAEHEKIEVKEEVELPNSADEFDEAIMEQIEPHDNWVGHTIKEREVKKQISDLIQGGDPDERESAIDRIFEKYKSRSSSAGKKPFDLITTFAGGAHVISDRNREENGDYKKVAHVSTKDGIKWLFPMAEKDSEVQRYAESLLERLKQEEIENAQPPVAQTDTPDQSELETLETSQIDITATPEKKKDYYEINKQIEKLLQEKGNGPYSPEEKAFLAKFSGYGGLHEYMPLEERKDTKILYEFFTPVKIVQTMWGLAYKYGYKGGPVLEPSAGTGAFIQFAPRDAEITAYELNPISAKILKILYPNVNVINSKFENAFIENRKSVGSKVEPKYDLVIGNPPFGKFSGMEAAFEKKHTKAGNYIDYFITRSLDVLKPGGLLVFIVGTSVESGGVPFLERDFVKAKKDIRDKSALLDAYRLPNGVFDRTNVLTDIIVLQKK